MTTPSLESRLDALESRVAIQTVVHRYARALDTRDADLLRGQLHDDAVVDLGDFGLSEGADAVVKDTQGLWARMPFMHHWMSNIVIDLDGETAEATSEINGVMFDAASGPAQVSGTYHDRFARRDGRWALIGRRFALHFWTPLVGWTPATGAEGEAWNARAED